MVVQFIISAVLGDSMALVAGVVGSFPRMIPLPRGI